MYDNFSVRLVMKRVMVNMKSRPLKHQMMLTHVTLEREKRASCAVSLSNAQTTHQNVRTRHFINFRRRTLIGDRDGFGLFVERSGSPQRHQCSVVTTSRAVTIKYLRVSANEQGSELMLYRHYFQHTLHIFKNNRGHRSLDGN